MSRYNNTTKSRKSLNATYNNRAGNVLKYNTTLYEKNTETDSDIFIKTQEGDRLDLLADNFYGDSSLWWFIASVNNISTMNVEAGLSLRIPSAIENAKGR